MVRTAIACARCRRSKVKCYHDGTPPCRGCMKAGTTGECVLSGPVLKKRQSSVALSKIDRRKADTGSPRRLTSRPRQWIKTDDEDDGVDWALPGPVNSGFTSLARRAAHVFIAHFPELGFLHMPSFSQELKELEDMAGKPDAPQSPGPATGVTVFCYALVALCTPVMQDDCDAETYASFARRGIMEADLPDRRTVQTLLVLAMYEWGSGRAYRAWAYSGMATRMMQLLNTMSKTEGVTDLQLECLNRTFWSCYVMDRLIVCGKPQPLTLPLESMEIHWPVGQRDFAFGQASARTYPSNTFKDVPCDDMDDSYRILMQGHDIGAQILAWVTGGGRRRPDLCPEGGVIWSEKSAWWRHYNRLQLWRASQGRRIRFPDTPIEVHVSLGHGYAFAYINLLYYLSLLFLGREYIPFLPTPASEPSGPVDPPLLPRAPQGWWADRADEVFTSSAHITDILRRMDAAGAPFLAPFPGFCALSASTMNSYVSCFPRMNLHRSKTATEDLASNLSYLNRFRSTWPMGEGWWNTIHQTNNLYQRASRDRGKFQGKTRADYEGLHTSIHDSSGISPAAEPQAETSRPAETTTGQNPFPKQEASGYQPQGEPAVAAAISLQDLSHSQPHANWGMVSPVYQGVSDWSDTWPLWGEQVINPFSFDGVHLEGNTDVINLP